MTTIHFRAIQESLSLSQTPHQSSTHSCSPVISSERLIQPDSPLSTNARTDEDLLLEEQLRQALELSEMEKRDEERRLREEEEMLEKALELSLKET